MTAHAPPNAAPKRRQPWWPVLVAAVAPIALYAFAWYVWFRSVGYSPASVVAIQIVGVVIAVCLMVAFRIRWRELGLGLRHLGWALVAGALAYALIMGAATGLNLAFDAGLRVLRPNYQLVAFLDNWLLTALGEELLYAGVVFLLAARWLGPRRRWLAVPLAALVFALAHLPGYLAMDLAPASVAGRLGLNAASWAIFGTIYLLSGNLWLVVVAHAATDYGLTPLVTAEPLFGLAFMLVLVLAAYWQPRMASAKGVVPPAPRRRSARAH
jgi:membrane protease YdiL (CAAX protease family)